MINRDNTITLAGTDVPVHGWGVISADEGARSFPPDQYAYAHEYAMVVDGLLAAIVDVGMEADCGV